MANSTAFGFWFGDRSFANGPASSGVSPIWFAISCSILFCSSGERACCANEVLAMLQAVNKAILRNMYLRRLSMFIGFVALRTNRCIMENQLPVYEKDGTIFPI